MRLNTHLMRVTYTSYFIFRLGIMTETKKGNALARLAVAADKLTEAELQELLTIAALMSVRETLQSQPAPSERPLKVH